MNNKVSNLKTDSALLIVRLIIGAIFIFAGWMKVTDMAGTVGMFNSMHIPVFLTYIVSYGELIGGILLVLGLWTCLASAFLFIIMAVAIYITSSNGFGAIMTPLATLAGTVATFGLGAGKYSIDGCMKSRKEKKLAKEVLGSVS